MSANTKPIPKRRSVFKLLVFTASAAAAMIALVFVIFGRYADNTDDILLSVPSEVVVTQYFGATESDVVNYFLTEQPSESISDEDVLEYLSSSGMVNLYALMDY